MAVECEDAFADAVDAILDFLVPYRIYQLSYSLRLERQHETLLAQHPTAFIRLASALIDPAVYPVPNDLPTLLEEYLRADPLVANQPGYIRLFALRKQMGAWDGWAWLAPLTSPAFGRRAHEFNHRMPDLMVG